VRFGASTVLDGIVLLSNWTVQYFWKNEQVRETRAFVSGPEALRPDEDLASAISGASRTDAKRLAIIDAATQLFIARGYDRTSMDEIAASAQVSKQTVYKQFQDKPSLFREMVLGITQRAEGIVEAISAHFEGIDRAEELEEGLRGLARSYAGAVLAPPVIRLRRLVISEADRFPDLARAYYVRAPGCGLDAVADGLRLLDRRSLLHVDDPPVAAGHFSYLVLGQLIDRKLFDPSDQITDTEIAEHSHGAVRVFIAAYR